MMHAYAYANANAMQLRTKHLKCYSASVRWILICVVGVHFFQQASDIDAIVLYGPLVFRKADMSSNKAILGDTVERRHRQDVLRPGDHPFHGPPHPAAFPPR
jgi:hypothetical protein